MLPSSSRARAQGRAHDNAHVPRREAETHTEAMRVKLDHLERALAQALRGTASGGEDLAMFDFFKKIVNRAKEPKDEKKPADHDAKHRAQHPTPPHPASSHPAERMVLELPEKYLNQMERLLAIVSKLLELLVAAMAQGGQDEGGDQDETTPASEEARPTPAGGKPPPALTYYYLSK